MFRGVVLLTFVAVSAAAVASPSSSQSSSSSSASTKRSESEYSGSAGGSPVYSPSSSSGSSSSYGSSSYAGNYGSSAYGTGYVGSSSGYDTAAAGSSNSYQTSQPSSSSGSQGNLYYYYYPVQEKKQGQGQDYQASGSSTHSAVATAIPGLHQDSTGSVGSGLTSSITGTGYGGYGGGGYGGAGGLASYGTGYEQAAAASNSYDASALAAGGGGGYDAASAAAAAYGANPYQAQESAYAATYNQLGQQQAAGGGGYASGGITGPYGAGGYDASHIPGYGQYPAASTFGQQTAGGEAPGQRRYGLSSLIMPMLALAGLGLLIPTVTSLSGRKKRATGDKASMGDYVERLAHYYSIYRSASESEECMNRIICELGHAVSDVRGKTGYLSIMEKFVPSWMRQRMTVFKSAALSAETGKCKKFKC